MQASDGTGDCDDVAMSDAASNDDESKKKWRLIRSFSSDDQGVRAACVLSNQTLVTGTQMGGMYLFDLETSALKVDVETYQHDHAVTALIALPSSTSFATATDSTTSQQHLSYFASGSKDAIIRIFAYDEKNSKLQMVSELKGHEKPVTSLAVLQLTDADHYYLASGSWDGTCAIWDVRTKARVAVLDGHENSVCVAPWIMPSSAAIAAASATTAGSGTTTSTLLGVATGSAGVASQGNIVQHALRLWTVDVRTGERQIVHKIVQDHEGPIRDVVASPLEQQQQVMLATCSNDGTVKLRSNVDGRSMATLTFLTEQQSHPPMLLSCAYVPKATTIVAGAEDGHVVAWDVNPNRHHVPQPQVIRHPSCVWQVFSVELEDDGGNGSYFGTCCQDGKVYLFAKGSDDGHDAAETTTLQRDFNLAVEAATASKRQGPSAEEIAKLPLWQNQQAMPGRSEGQVQVFNKDGVAIAAQWSAASRTWIEVGQVMGSSGDDDSGGAGGGGGGSGVLNGVRYDHILPIEVDQTGGGVANLQIGYNSGENPFVAAQRFIDEHMLPQHHLAEIADYITQRVGSGTASRTLGGSVPSGAPPPSATTGVPMVSFQHVPAKAYKSFDLKPSAAESTFDKMGTKLREFGCLSDDQLQRVESLMRSLSVADAPMSDSDLTVLADMLSSMPVSQCFPALDLARLAVLRPDASTTPDRETLWKNLLQKSLMMCQQAGSNNGDTKLEGPAAVAIPMLSLRLCSNAFANPSSGGPASIAATYMMDFLSSAKSHVRSSNKNIRLSVATVLHNVCLYAHTNSVDDAVADVVVEIIDDVLTCRMYNESEAVMRSLVALGTLVMSSPAGKKAAQQRFMASKAEPAASPHNQDVKLAAKEVYALLA